VERMSDLGTTLFLAHWFFRWHSSQT
jgi:hypothetical protein